MRSFAKHLACVLAVLGTLVLFAPFYPARAAPAPNDTAAPMWNACRQACDAANERALLVCERKRTPVAKAQCRRAVQVVYSACLAKCPPEEG